MLLQNLRIAGRTGGFRGPARRGVLTLVAWILLLFGSGVLASVSALAQVPGSAQRTWRATVGADTLRGAGMQPEAEVLRLLADSGYPFARVLRTRIDSSTSGLVTWLHVERGPEVVVRDLQITGIASLDGSFWTSRFKTRSGRVFAPATLERDLDSLLGAYERAGFFLAQAEVTSVQFVSDEPPEVDVRVTVREGVRPVLGRILLPGSERTREAFAARLVGLKSGQAVRAFDPAQIRGDLEASGVFREVGVPTVQVYGDSTFGIIIPVEDVPPGVFDFALGYQPPSGGARGRLVGSGHLALRNLLGYGRAASLQIDRLPGRVSVADAQLSDPFLFGSPVGVQGSFHGLQDSTNFGKQQLSVGLNYRVAAGARAMLTFARERTRPGQTGALLTGGRQSVARADASFYGIGVRVQRVDRLSMPRKGLLADLLVERGRKARNERVVTSGDTLRVAASSRQDRVSGSLRAFLPVRSTEVIVFGADLRMLVSDSYDRSDLFRLGGATTLRGFDEQRFEGRVVGRALLEARHVIDYGSYIFAFMDAGYVQNPLGEGRAARQTPIGFGAGIQFETNLGLLNASYAMNREGGRLSGRVHIGLSVGL